MKKDLIPHQIHLSKEQIVRLGKGLSTNIRHSQMGSDKGDFVVMLHPQNARRMLTSYTKGKGMRLCLSPDEMMGTEKKGSGFFKGLKKTTGIGKAQFISEAKNIGKEVVHRGSSVVGTAITAYTGNPMLGEMVSQSLDKAGTSAIDSIEPSKSKYGIKFRPQEGVSSLKEDAMKYAVESIDRRVDRLPANQKAIAERALAGEYPSASSLIFDVADKYQARGRGLMKGSAEMKERMARLRSMRGQGVGSKIEKAFKPLSSKKAMDVYKKIGKHAIEEGIPVATTLASMALGDPTGASGAVVGNIASQYASEAYDKKTGGMFMEMTRPKRGRGRPRKMGKGAVSSKPFKKAMKHNFDGLQVENFADNKPASSYKINPKINASSSEMTLSPYARLDSPAMNPFVPKSYIQEGGTQSGYGGRGLYGGGLY